MKPTHLVPRQFTLHFSPVELLELQHEESLLEQDGAPSRGLSGNCIPLYGLTVCLRSYLRSQKCCRKIIRIKRPALSSSGQELDSAYQRPFWVSCPLPIANDVIT